MTYGSHLMEVMLESKTKISEAYERNSHIFPQAASVNSKGFRQESLHLLDSDVISISEEVRKGTWQ